MDSITITATKDHLDDKVALPLSKSISNRSLMLNAISGGLVKYDLLSDADDTKLLQHLLGRIQAGNDSILNAGNAGTVYRFLTAYLSIKAGEWTLDGDQRMRQRPIGPLVDSLRRLGADITYQGRNGFPPLLIRGRQLAGGRTEIDAGMSSQFASALMMIGPVLPSGLELKIKGDVSSQAYISMTTRLMKAAGAETDVELPAVKIKGSGYSNSLLRQESDWSSAAFWYALLALSKGGELLLQGLKSVSLQGDRITAEYFRMLGVETSYTEQGALIRKRGTRNEHIDLNLEDSPDLAPAIIVATAALGLSGNFYGLSNLKNKESDRLAALSAELAKAGIRTHTTSGKIEFKAQKLRLTKAVDPHMDHRIAMAFAPLAILGKPLTIKKPGVVSKSYPQFWEELKKVIRGTISDQ
ncbi:MAG: 3-phosphoshikimate 1-carboxyvinyltransferase [Bacteroidales bacterium]|nr:3-phosphoshikimate 1-carboxyvinyltransferase [Bacteroidales bacterium]